jgi:cytoskeletal protein RodZ
LFSAFRSPPKLQAVVVSRSVLLWSIGLLVLVIGLMLLHVRALRRPSVLLVLAVVLAAAGLSWPASALVVAQVAAVALLVLAAAAAWQWSVSGKMPYAAPAPPSSSEPKSTAATAPRAQSQPQIPATTATAPLLGVTEPQP